MPALLDGSISFSENCETLFWVHGVFYTPWISRSRVRKWCTIQVAGHSYSVPSRRIGKEVQIRLYADWVEMYYKGHLVERMAPVRGEGEANVNYRHVIDSLVRKPGAFARYRFREQLFPTMQFRLAYDALKEWRGERADVE